MNIFINGRLLLALVLACYSAFSWAGLVTTIAKIKPSIVAVGSYHPTGSPRSVFSGTGFVVGDGSLVVTNYHVVPSDLNPTKREQLVIFVGKGSQPKVYDAKVIASDRVHDLAVLKIEGIKLTPLRLGNDKAIQEGQSIAFTGYPIGAVLGLYAATHTGIISAITPIATPQISSAQLTPQMLKQLRKPYQVFQLDATAYPGNSGSPVYNTDTGQVIGVINKVFIQGSREAAITNPSGISYAIPIRYVKALLK
ncbi:serine protease [Motilimonas sp. 1_MG-2023]|uniref:S1C family serine protease n=1 Tax=Motilimonas sp. 1_MG-2023 TaxID=3062672 RepID=UPI0026E43E0B|nr:serine protease [Motilimonas sp. 1_MG-2023]MDO6524441.1 serine protease [Motilimonas sp. 1_MG-2023]